MPEFNEADALSAVEELSDAESFVSDRDETGETENDRHDGHHPYQDVPRTEFDEDTLHELLNEDVSAPTGAYAFESEMDDDAMLSAGMDIGSMLDMGGEDWKGFRLSPEQLRLDFK
ncbi:hypothetical protein P4S72_03875 [Vibrio sp. PP-XX7]